ncbi:MAG: 50S ribosomal protein L6 [Clostridia bacterium]|nr:50S ribosomal protein L6 [Clostridia bacterium]
MSRIGRLPITVPHGVEVKIDGHHITVKGAKGQLERNIHPSNNVEQDNGVLHVKRNGDTKEERSLHGLTRALVHSMVVGVTEGFSKSMIINGVGYKAQATGNKLVLNIGYSHPVEMIAPEGITFECPSLTEIVVKGIDKELVGQTCANIRATRPVEPYHAYGVRYKTEVVVLKEGKKNAK